jgi:hypothetical protein
VRVRRRGLGLAALALVLVADPGQALAQAGSDAASEVEQRRQRLEDFDPNSDAQGGVEEGGADLAFPDPPEQGALSSPATAQAYKEALQAYYAYREAGYEQRLGVFEWQLLSTKIIFVVVLLLVLAGIYFAAIQFHSGLRRRAGANPAGPDETEVSLSLSEVKLRSPVLGVIILTISLAFFYLYLVHVYPIRNVF